MVMYILVTCMAIASGVCQIKGDGAPLILPEKQCREFSESINRSCLTVVIPRKQTTKTAIGVWVNPELVSEYAPNGGLQRRVRRNVQRSLTRAQPVKALKPRKRRRSRRVKRRRPKVASWVRRSKRTHRKRRINRQQRRSVNTLANSMFQN